MRHRGPPRARRIEPCRHGGLGLVLRQAVEADRIVGRIDGDALPFVGGVLKIGAVGVLGRPNRPDDVEAVGAGELPIARIVRRDGHDCARSVPHQHVVRDEDRNLLAVGGVDSEQPGEDARLRALVVGPFNLALGCGGGAVFRDGLGRGRSPAGPQVIRPLGPRLGDVQARLVGLAAGNAVAEDRMLGGHRHKCGAEKRVGPGRVNLEPAAGSGNVELDARAFRTADPVALHKPDLLGPVDGVEVVGQPVGVGGDAHHPLPQVPLENGEVSALGAPVGRDFLIGQNRSQTGAPVDRGLADVGQTARVEHLALLAFAELGPLASVVKLSLPRVVFVAELRNRACRAFAPTVSAGGVRVVPGVVYLQKNPLRPTHVVDVGGRKGPARIVGETDALELAAHVRDVLLSGDARMLAGLHGVLLRRQAEGVESHRVEHVLAEHALIPGDRVRCDVPERVAHVKALARGVGKHVENVDLLSRRRARKVADRVRGVERPELFPAFLPPRFDRVGQFGRVPVRRRPACFLSAHRPPFIILVCQG